MSEPTTEGPQTTGDEAPVTHRFSDMLLQDRIRFAFSFLLLLLFIYTAYESLDFRPLARYLPLGASVVAATMMLFSILVDVATFRRTGRVAVGDVSDTSSVAIAADQEVAAEEGESAPTEFRGPRTQSEAILRSFGVMGWVFAYVAGIAVVGLMVATPIYLFTYLRREAKASWKLTIIGNAAILLLLTVMREALNLRWPPYLLQNRIDTLMEPLYQIGNDLIRTIIPFL